MAKKNIAEKPVRAAPKHSGKMKKGQVDSATKSLQATVKRQAKDMREMQKRLLALEKEKRSMFAAIHERDKLVLEMTHHIEVLTQGADLSAA